MPSIKRTLVTLRQEAGAEDVSGARQRAALSDRRSKNDSAPAVDHFDCERYAGDHALHFSRILREQFSCQFHGMRAGLVQVGEAFTPILENSFVGGDVDEVTQLSELPALRAVIFK